MSRYRGGYCRNRYRGNKELWTGILILLASVLAFWIAPFSVEKFAAFPALFGVFVILLWAADRCEAVVARTLRRLLWSGFTASVIIFFAMGTMLVFGARSQIKSQPQVMIVLGAQVKTTGPSSLLVNRLDTALEYWESNQGMTIVVSGGQGPDEPWTEASAMAEYLLNGGVPREQLLLEDRSSNTYENLSFSLALLRENGYNIKDDMMVVSNGFHLTRVRMLWDRVAGEEVVLSTLAAPGTDMASLTQSYIREVPALIKSWIFDR